MQTWYSNGKLLITGEYLVMEGALSLALPLNVGQSISAERNNNNHLFWQANKPDGNWFTANYELPTLKLVADDNISLAEKLLEILLAAKTLDNNFLSDGTGYDVITNLGFKPEFGFGTSSTLISNIAMWAEINPYLLLQRTFGGSGYDIACSQSKSPIFYQLIDGAPTITDVNFDPPFADKLYFIYLGKKQSSSEGISAFKKQSKFTSIDIESISEITNEIIETTNLTAFERLLTDHERIMSKVLKLPTVKSVHFNDFPGVVKSLGAWGGDFVLVTYNESENNLRNYMQNKGFDTIFKYDELVLNSAN